MSRLHKKDKPKTSIRISNDLNLKWSLLNRKTKVERKMF